MMKLYVLPVEKACQASCGWCITDFRETAEKEWLSVEDLVRRLGVLPALEKIELTGGGEPLLHPRLKEIVQVCVREAPTMVYTNGALLERRAAELCGVYQVAISRAHHDDEANERIMGVRYDWSAAVRASPAPVKASLLLHKGGIETVEGVHEYLDWLARSGVRTAVIRQLFEHEDVMYQARFGSARISTGSVYRALGGTEVPREGNPSLVVAGVNAEFEIRTCACEMRDPVLHADGRLYRGWTQEVIG